MTTTRNYPAAIVYMLLASSGIGFIGATAKYVTAFISPEIFAALSRAAALLATLGFIAIKGPSILKSKHYRLYFFRAFCGASSIYCFLICLNELPLVDTISLNNTMPIFGAIIARIWLREKLPPLGYASILVGFFGAILIIKPGSEIFNPISLLGLLAACLIALSELANRKLSKLNEPTSRIIIFFFLLTPLFSFLPWASSGFEISQLQMLALKNWAWYFIIANIFILTIQYAITKSLSLASAPEVMPLRYISIIASSIAGWLLFKEIPTSTTIFGIILIVLSGTLLIISQKKNSKP